MQPIVGARRRNWLDYPQRFEAAVRRTDSSAV
jgi:hypothetical protein